MLLSLADRILSSSGKPGIVRTEDPMMQYDLPATPATPEAQNVGR